MTTITKERIELFIKNPLENGLTRGEQMELARSVLASLDAEPAGYHVIKENGKVGCSVATLDKAEKTRDFWNKWWTIRPYFYSAPPVQETGVYNDVLNIIGLLENNEWAEHCTSTVLGSLLESEITRLVGKEQPMPVVPPAIEPDYEVIKGILPTANPDEYACCIAADMWNACRTAMLQGSQPVSNRDELQVIGWLRSDYNSDDKRDPNAPLFMLGRNDPSEAWGVKYIPLSGNSPVSPEDLRRAFEAVARLNNEMYCWTSCMSYNGSYNGEPEGLLKRNIREIEHIMDSCRATMLQDNQRDLSQPVDPQVAEYEQIMLQAGNYPVIPDGWISCSERMPVIGELNWRTSFPLLVTCEIGVIPAYYGFVRVNGNKHYGFMESLKYGDDSGNHPQTNEYDLISNVTHWMPLPEPPQQ